MIIFSLIIRLAISVTRNSNTTIPSYDYHILHLKNILWNSIYQIITCNKQQQKKTTSNINTSIKIRPQCHFPNVKEKLFVGLLFTNTYIHIYTSQIRFDYLKICQISNWFQNNSTSQVLLFNIHVCLWNNQTYPEFPSVRNSPGYPYISPHGNTAIRI